MINNKEKTIAKYTRLIILGLILGGTMVIHYLHISLGPRVPSVHALCPLGGLENLWAWIGGNANLQKLFNGTMTLFFFMLIFAVVFGRAFCGNICPFGALQEFTGKIKKRKLAVPQKADRILRLLKYLILVFITVMAWITATIWISPYDPYAAFAHIWTGTEILGEYGVGFIILVIVIVASIFIDRFFCKYLCPAGALYGIISKISPTKIKRSSCSMCGQCSKVCPMNIDVTKIDTVKSPECINCTQCVVKCPSKSNDLQITFFKKAVKPFVFIVASVLIFFGSLFIFHKAGIFQITIPSLESVMESGNFLQIADLRGSISIQDGAEYVGMELSDFYNLMEIPETVPKETLLREVSSFVPGWDFHVIRNSR
ncbi:MAG: 4Fe-4S binding protein [Treponema sp.]|jgi:polyferredoxin|nr:4Fe-4S binding protein [Treponema sp.]